MVIPYFLSFMTLDIYLEHKKGILRITLLHLTLRPSLIITDDLVIPYLNSRYFGLKTPIIVRCVKQIGLH